MALRAEVSTFDPHKGASGTDHMYLYPVFDTLVRFDDKLQPRPGLAESWDTTDPKTLVLRLRKNVKFHDGTPFNAEAVKFTVDRLITKGVHQVYGGFSTIERADVVDASTINIVTSKPDPILVKRFANSAWNSWKRNPW